jgi:starch phosphorylase
VARQRNDGYDPWIHYHENAELRQALDMIANGYFSPEEPTRFRSIFDSLTSAGDRYFLLADFADYIACHKAVETLYCDRDAWTRRAILNVSRMGRFSSDRTVRDYIQSIWGGNLVSRRGEESEFVRYKLAASGG